VIELEDHWVLLPAVNAGMVAQEVDEASNAVDHQLPAAFRSVVDVSLLVGSVVLLLIGGTTGAAIVVPLPIRFSPPCEVFNRFIDPAATTLTH
jgi:hypothetical protein